MTTDELDRLRDGLRRLADNGGADVRADIERARSRGRRTLRMRRVVAVAAPAMMIAGIAAVALPDAEPEPVRPQKVTAAAPRPLPNPLLKKAAFGWLPTGFPDSIVSVEDGSFSLTAQGEGDSQIIVTVFPPGPEPDLGFMRGGVRATPIPVDPIGGRPAHWLQPPSQTSGEARLRVRYGPRQWVEIEVNALPGGDVTDIIRRVARGVRLGAEPTAFPLRIRGLPAVIKPVGASVSTPGSSVGGEVSLWFTPGLGITLTPPDSERLRRPANTQIDGRAALRETQGKSERLCVFGMHGYNVCLSAVNGTSKLLEPSGGLLGLYKQITVLGPDPAKWTTTPLYR